MKYLYSSLLVAATMMVAISCMDESDLVKEPARLSPQPVHEFVPGEVIVKFRSGSSSSAGREAGILSVAEAEVIETIYQGGSESGAGRQGDEAGRIVLVRSKLGTLEAIARLKSLSEVEYAEPNFIYRHFERSDDPYYTNGSLWGMYGDNTSPLNTYGGQAGEAWAAGGTGSKEVWIGIIDEGYMYTHPDLSGNAASNPGEIAGDGIDNDGNGYVDDIYGWDFDRNDNSVFDGVDDDHGTHVAGTIGGIGGNGIGVAGVVWNVSLMNAKFLGKRGGTTSNAVKAVDYFTRLKALHGINIVATSNSWGGGGFSQALLEAIERAGMADILFIAAAGNSSNDNDASPSYPASYDSENVIAVASIDSNGALSGFSNWGATTVDLAAPGRGIYSTVPLRSKGSIVAGYASYSGTSMATPHVTGAAALYAAINPGATAAAIKSAIMQHVIPTESLKGKCASNGRLNVGDFLTSQPN